MQTLLSLFRLLIGFVVVMVASTVFIVVALLLIPWRIARIKLCNFYGKVVGRSVAWVAGVTPNVPNRAGIDGSMPAIYVSNHSSSLDGFIGIWLCPYGGCGVFKKEIVRIPFYGWLAWLSGHILLDRGNREKAVETLSKTAAFIKKNRLGIWMLPEGTRSRDGRLLPFKKGFVHLAIASGLPVVPVIVHGAHKNWRHGSWAFHPMTLDIDVLPPIDTSGWKEETSAEHAEAVRNVFIGALREDQKPLPAG